MNAASPLAGLEIRHGHRWGYSKSGESDAYLDREGGPPGRETILSIRDGGKHEVIALTGDGFRALFAAVIASRCPHHCDSHAEVNPDGNHQH